MMNESKQFEISTVWRCMGQHTVLLRCMPFTPQTRLPWEFSTPQELVMHLHTTRIPTWFRLHLLLDQGCKRARQRNNSDCLLLKQGV